MVMNPLTYTCKIQWYSGNIPTRALLIQKRLGHSLGKNLTERKNIYIFIYYHVYCWLINEHNLIDGFLLKYVAVSQSVIAPAKSTSAQGLLSLDKWIEHVFSQGGPLIISTISAIKDKKGKSCIMNHFEK